MAETDSPWEHMPVPAWLRTLAAQDSAGQLLAGGRNNQGVLLHQLPPP